MLEKISRKKKSSEERKTGRQTNKQADGHKVGKRKGRRKRHIIGNHGASECVSA